MKTTPGQRAELILNAARQAKGVAWWFDTWDVMGLELTSARADYVTAVRPEVVLGILSDLSAAEERSDSTARLLAVESARVAELTDEVGRLQRASDEVFVDFDQTVAERDALAAKLDAVRALHCEADNDYRRTPSCETCHGKAGVHECGCWSSEDRQMVCGHCNGDGRFESVPYPCPTVAILDRDGGE